MNKLLTFVLMGMLLASCSAPQAPAATGIPTSIPIDIPSPTGTPVPPLTDTPAQGIDHVYAFGDSLSDNGRAFKLASELVAKGQFDASVVKTSETYNWKGRAANGPAAVEILADQLEVDLTDYAFGGATSGYDNTQGELWDGTGLLAQIDEFESDLKGEQADPNALYFIHISGNDFIKYIIFEQSHSITDTIAIADQALVNIDTAVEHLAKLGARRFMVANSADISKMPDVNSVGFSTEGAAFQKRINSELPGRMENLASQLNLDMNFFDYADLSDEMHNTPGKFGLTNRSEPCLYLDESNTVVVCQSPDQYFYWDGLHPSRRASQIFGEAMAAQLSK